MIAADLPLYEDFSLHPNTGWCRNRIDPKYVYYCLDGDWRFTVIVEESGYYLASENDDPQDYEVGFNGVKIHGAETLEEACQLAYTLWRMQ